jgi:hypothetical protein
MGTDLMETLQMHLEFMHISVSFGLVKINLLVKSQLHGENVNLSPICRWTETEFRGKSQ